MQQEVLELFDAAAPGLRRYVRSCGLTPEVAEDVVQEAFLALFRHLCGGGARHNLRGWLVQVSYRLALRHREKAARLQRHESTWEGEIAEAVADPGDNPETQLTTREHQGRLQAVFRALPERERQCVSLRAEGVPVSGDRQDPRDLTRHGRQVADVRDQQALECGEGMMPC